MDEEFIFQVTEEELAQFLEEGNQSEEEQNQQEYTQGLEIETRQFRNLQKNNTKRITR